MNDAKKKCEQVINALITKGFLCQVNENELKVAIMRSLRVFDPRTLKNTTNALLALDYLIQSAPHVYKINLDVISEKATLDVLQSRQLTIEQSQEGIGDAKENLSLTN